MAEDSMTAAGAYGNSISSPLKSENVGLVKHMWSGHVQQLHAAYRSDWVVHSMTRASNV
jgi:hypothetical protein